MTFLLPIFYLLFFLLFAPHVMQAEPVVSPIASPVTFPMMSSADDQLKIMLTQEEIQTLIGELKKHEDSRSIENAVGKFVDKLLLQKKRDKKRYFKKRYAALLLLLLGLGYKANGYWNEHAEQIKIAKKGLDALHATVAKYEGPDSPMSLLKKELAQVKTAYDDQKVLLGGAQDHIVTLKSELDEYKKSAEQTISELEEKFEERSQAGLQELREFRTEVLKNKREVLEALSRIKTINDELREAVSQAKSDVVQAKSDAVQAKSDAVQAKSDAVQAKSDAVQASDFITSLNTEVGSLGESTSSRLLYLDSMIRKLETVFGSRIRSLENARPGLTPTKTPQHRPVEGNLLGTPPKVSLGNTSIKEMQPPRILESAFDHVINALAQQEQPVSSDSSRRSSPGASSSLSVISS